MFGSGFKPICIHPLVVLAKDLRQFLPVRAVCAKQQLGSPSNLPDKMTHAAGLRHGRKHILGPIQSELVPETIVRIARLRFGLRFIEQMNQRPFRRIQLRQLDRVLLGRALAGVCQPRFLLHYV